MDNEKIQIEENSCCASGDYFERFYDAVNKKYYFVCSECGNFHHWDINNFQDISDFPLEK